ncbi:MAG: serine/threonine-protein phosphatase [Gammaproteobacteria bacterium]|nr:serine/threonine-protein phosphatase [Gammaproteobacteria bacterium]MYG96331.1 serine/threonine-protein phosphatase [Gammaproteobacteria bacterium]
MSPAGAGAPEPDFGVEFACASDIGGQEEQQDRVAAFESKDALLLVLADGLGGHEGGAMAAQAVVDVAQHLFADGEEDCPERLFERIAAVSNRRILEKAKKGRWHSASTCVLLHLTSSRASWAHIGDSRLYVFDNGKLASRTLDHSVVELLRLKGKINAEEMKFHPDRSRLLEALGNSAKPQMEIGGKDAAPEDSFLLCSDGLWENISDFDLERAMGAVNLQSGLDRLLRRAKSNGGVDCDNISVAAARYERYARSSISPWRMIFQ